MVFLGNTSRTRSLSVYDIWEQSAFTDGSRLSTEEAMVNRRFCAAWSARKVLSLLVQPERIVENIVEQRQREMYLRIQMAGYDAVQYNKSIGGEARTIRQEIVGTWNSTLVNGAKMGVFAEVARSDNAVETDCNQCGKSIGSKVLKIVEFDNTKAIILDAAALDGDDDFIIADTTQPQANELFVSQLDNHMLAWHSGEDTQPERVSEIQKRLLALRSVAVASESLIPQQFLSYLPAL